MSSHSTQLFLHHNHKHNHNNLSHLDHHHRRSFVSSHHSNPNLISSGFLLLGGNNKDKRAYKVDRDVRSKCSAISKPRTNEFTGVFQSGVSVIKWQGIVEDDVELLEDKEEAIIKRKRRVWKGKEIDESVEVIKSMLSNIGDGEISVSAYDTAWVALVENNNDENKDEPRFPTSLAWIASNQLHDGSWGDSQIFSAHDRLINTLAAVVALKRWNVHPQKCLKGMKFFNENVSKLEKENPEHMPIGFEVAFPSLLEMARKLDLDVPFDSPALRQIYSMRDIKLTKIPRDIMHTVPTTLLHSLEGMTGLEWEKLLKLQSRDGSFLFSPSSTAFALMQTNDPNCFNYLSKALNKFNGGVPNVYPVDLFENLWVVDRLQRLGISRFFDKEIKDCITYVQRHWTEKGIAWARNSDVHDIDDTAMGFRLLRLHGHKVSADVFKNFKKGEEFFCFSGQSNQAVTGMYNLFRASQLMFSGENILEAAKDFSSRFLKEKQANNQLLDKWIITKDLPGEVGYALEVPWYANLPRVETRFFIEHYGGQNDVWIGKTLYRMPYVNNNEYLALAKKDFNTCQELHSIEWHNFQKWYTDCRVGEFGLSRKSLLMAYYLSAASIFEPNRADERLAWAKTAALMEAIKSHFNDHEINKKAFVHAFMTSSNTPGYLITRRSNMNKSGQRLLQSLVATLSHLSLDSIIVNGKDISPSLRQAWEKWMLRWQEGYEDEDAELLVQTLNLISGRSPMEGLSQNPHYKNLFTITNSVCHKIIHHQNQTQNKGGCNKSKMAPEIESEMQELTRSVLESSSDNNRNSVDDKIKQTFMMVAKTFYYSVYYDSETINSHIDKVLFHSVG